MKHIVVMLAITAGGAASGGCSTVDLRGEGAFLGGAVAAITGSGDPVSVAAGGYLGYILGSFVEKKEGRREKNMALKVKENYTATTSVTTLSEQINAVSNCVAKGIPERACFDAVQCVVRMPHRQSTCLEIIRRALSGAQYAGYTPSWRRESVGRKHASLRDPDCNACHGRGAKRGVRQ